MYVFVRVVLFALRNWEVGLFRWDSGEFTSVDAVKYSNHRWRETTEQRFKLI
jgi:hypothetical protein